MEEARTQARNEIEGLASALKQERAAGHVSQSRIGALEAKQAAMTDQEAAARKAMEEAKAQAEGEIARLGSALEQAQATEQNAQTQIAALEAELAALTEQTMTHRQGLEETQTQAETEIARLEAALKQAQTTEQGSKDPIGALEAELAALTKQAAADRQGMEKAQMQSETEIARLGAALEQAQAAEQSLQDRIGALETELAALTEKAAADRQGMEEAQAQSEAEIARLSTALEQAQATEQDSQELIGTLKNDLAQLKTDSSSQIERMTLELAAMKQKLQGLEGDRDNDGVADVHDRCQGTPANLATDASGCVSIELRGVEFASGSDHLRPTSKAVLNNMASLLTKVSFPVEIQGHTDSSGTPEINQQLSQSRAEAVLSYLVEQGVPAETLSAKGYGDTRPIADNETPAGRSLNRRVELTRQRQ